MDRSLKYPPAADASVAYNIPDDAAGGDMELEIHNAAIVRTAARVPRFHLKEYADIERLTARTVRRHLKDTGYRKWDELHDYVWSMSSIGDARGDRSLQVVVEPRMLTPQFIELLQSKILSRFPLWRICVTLYSDRRDLALAVYPDAVSIGIECWREPIEIAERVDHLSKSLEAVRKAEIKYRVRQFKHLVRLTREAVKGLDNKPIVFVVAFDNADGDFTQFPVWYIHEARDTFVCSEGESDEVLSGESYPVSERGRRSTVPSWISSISFGRVDLCWKASHLD